LAATFFVVAAGRGALWAKHGEHENARPAASAKKEKEAFFNGIIGSPDSAAALLKF